MKASITYLLLIVALFWAEKCNAQPDCIIPASPTLDFVTVNPSNGDVTLNWLPSPSTGIAAYIVYTYNNGAGMPIDTIWNPSATSYTYSTLATKYFSVTYVVAAHRSPNCTSPLSNHLNTIFVESAIDTCSKNIIIKWNKYYSEATQVKSYAIMSSKDNGGFTQLAELTNDETEYYFEDFSTNSQYSFYVEAKFGDGRNSKSNLTSVITNMQRPPDWINADYATVENNRIELSFTYDPYSEIKTFSLEKQTGSGSFTELARINASGGNTIKYTDGKADVLAINSYRLSTTNNCENPVIISNEATNIALKIEKVNSSILFTWNAYRKWNGVINNYSIFVVYEGNPVKIAEVSPVDTTYILDYDAIMYEVNSDRICFFISAIETSNPYGINSAVVSQIECISPVEAITVPDVFTPNGDLINDFFKPVLSFMPSEYHLIITDRQGRILFETKDHDAQWDGRFNGSNVSQDVYLWRLRVKTPSQSVVSKTGTVTVYFNRQ